MSVLPPLYCLRRLLNHFVSRIDKLEEQLWKKHVRSPRIFLFLLICTHYIHFIYTLSRAVLFNANVQRNNFVRYSAITKHETVPPIKPVWIWLTVLALMTFLARVFSIPSDPSLKFICNFEKRFSLTGRDSDHCK